MNIRSKQLLFALAFPVIALGALTGYKAYQRSSGVELAIPITGYDPRDILSGHYLTYRLKFDDNVCASRGLESDPVFVCVVQHRNDISSWIVPSLDSPEGEGCTAIIRGKCDGWRFVAGVERFYIPEEYSYILDSAVRGWGENRDRAKLVISVGMDGHAAVKELLIDDKPWQEYLAAVKQ